MISYPYAPHDCGDKITIDGSGKFVEWVSCARKSINCYVYVVDSNVLDTKLSSVDTNYVCHDSLIHYANHQLEASPFCIEIIESLCFKLLRLK